MDFLKKITKKKIRRILTLSAASVHSGLHCVYIEINKKDWHILNHSIVPYPQKIRPVIEQALSNQETRYSMHDIAMLDNAISYFALECAQTVVNSVSHTPATPDLIIFDRMALWKGDIGTEAKNTWSLHLGEPQLIASAMKTVVFTDLVRHDILAGGTGVLPLVAGDFSIAKKAGEVAVLLNIGIFSHMTIIDSRTCSVLVNSETGPGTYLINKAAKQAGIADGFDRDGKEASKGKIDTSLIEKLARMPWFLLPAPKSADISIFDSLLTDSGFALMPPTDVLATVTALTARTISNFFRNNYNLKDIPETLWISGGGTKNACLVEYLKAYFSPIHVKSVAELDIPAESRFPVALALSVNALLEKDYPDEKGKNKFPVPVGKWVFP